MSHYTTPNSSTQAPRARVAFFGCSLVAVGLLGFYRFLSMKHERKHALDRASEDRTRISSWEHRMLQRAHPVESSDSPAVLRAARIEGRSAPPPPTRTHEPRHRTVADDRAALRAAIEAAVPTAATNDADTPEDTGNAANVATTGRPASLEQPTAQKGHPDGRSGVYTKAPGWREHAHYASNSGQSKKSPEINSDESTAEGEAQKGKEVTQGLEEKVQSWFGSGKSDK